MNITNQHSADVLPKKRRTKKKGPIIIQPDSKLVDAAIWLSACNGFDLAKTYDIYCRLRAFNGNARIDGKAIEQ